MTDQTAPCNCRQPGLGGDCDGSCECPKPSEDCIQTSDGNLASFDTTDTEFVYEHMVGLTVHAHRAAPWLSWDETKALAEWLTAMIAYGGQDANS